VFADQLQDPATLSKILEVHFAGDPIPSDPEETLPLSGGFALLHGEEVVVLPRCCGDLGDLENWTRALQHEHAEPTLWIGHPSLSVRREGDVLFLQDEHEGPTQPPSGFRISTAALGEAIARAAPELDALFERLLLVLGAMAPQTLVRPLAARLVGR
jgi:hypothetical protein